MAQQSDFAVGASTMLAGKFTSTAQSYSAPELIGGTYVNGSLKIGWKKHLGFNGEFSTRYKKGLYNGYQDFRPVLYDANAVWSMHLAPRYNADVMAGAGGETLIFYNEFAPCPSNFVVCSTRATGSHVLGHLGGDLRYNFRGRFFVRPELHYYRVFNNTEFHSGNLFRASASIGFTFGGSGK